MLQVSLRCRCGRAKRSASWGILHLGWVPAGPLNPAGPVVCGAAAYFAQARGVPGSSTPPVGHCWWTSASAAGGPNRVRFRPFRADRVSQLVLVPGAACLAPPARQKCRFQRDGAELCTGGPHPLDVHAQGTLGTENRGTAHSAPIPALRCSTQRLDTPRAGSCPVGRHSHSKSHPSRHRTCHSIGRKQQPSGGSCSQTCSTSTHLRLKQAVSRILVAPGGALRQLEVGVLKTHHLLAVGRGIFAQQAEYQCKQDGTNPRG
jgi:hypothetical protein